MFNIKLQLNILEKYVPGLFLTLLMNPIFFPVDYSMGG